MCAFLVGMQNGIAIWKILIKLNIHLSYDPTISLLNICSRDMKICFYLKTHARLFITTLFIITPNWKQPKFSWTIECFLKSQHTMDHYSVIFLKKWTAGIWIMWRNLKKKKLSKKVKYLYKIVEQARLICSSKIWTITRILKRNAKNTSEAIDTFFL